MDVNDCPPRFAKSSYTTFVAENSEVGAIITLLTATDEDEGNHGQVMPDVLNVYNLLCVCERTFLFIDNKNVCSDFLFRSSTVLALMKVQ